MIYDEFEGYFRDVIAGLTGNLHTNDHLHKRQQRRRAPLQKCIYIYPRVPAFERGTPLASALPPGRK